MHIIIRKSTDNDMAKNEKGQTIVHKTHHRQLKTSNTKYIKKSFKTYIYICQLFIS